MENDIKNKINDFVLGKNLDINSEYYCKTRDIFQARLNKMTSLLLLKKDIKEDDIYIISAIAGEIGNNSFDHNIGSWVGVMGVFFSYSFDNNNFKIFLADIGQGVYKTLKKVKPEIKNDKEALWTAFNEKISGRAPESRGNGLKFVKASIKNSGLHLIFFSGNAKVQLNNIEKIEKTEKKYQGSMAIISLK